MNGRLLSPADLEPVEDRAWRSLAGRAMLPNPLFEADCLVPAATHLPNGKEISLLVASEESEMQACFPVREAQGFRALRRPVLTTQVRRMTYDGTPLLAPERAVEAVSAMLSLLGARSRHGAPGLLVFNWLDVEGPVFPALEEAARRLGMPWYVYDRWERPVVRLPEHQGPARSWLTGDFSRSLRRRQRLLRDTLGAEAHLVDRADPAAVEELVRLEGAGYKAETGLAMSVHGEEEWFRQMCDRFRAARRLHVFALQSAEGEVLAVQAALTADGVLFQLKTAYDERFARFSPGVQLQLDVLDFAREHLDVRMTDSCTYAGNDTLQRVCPDRRQVADVVVGIGGAIDRAHLRAVALARGLTHEDSALRDRLRARHRTLDPLFERLAPALRRLSPRRPG